MTRSTTGTKKPAAPNRITRKEFEDVKSRLQQAEFHIDKVLRKSRGTTLANARAVKLERDKLEVQLNKVGDGYNVTTDPIQKSAFAAEFARLDKALTDFSISLSTRLTTLESTVAGQELEIGLLSEGQQSLVGRADRHRAELNELNDSVNQSRTVLNRHNSRITVLEEDRKVPIWKLVVAGIIGIIGGLCWAGIDFVGSLKLPDGQSIPILYEFADSWWAAMLAGISTFGMVLGLLLLFTRSGSRQNTYEDVETIQETHVVTPVPTAPIHITESAAPYRDSADATPTKVIPTNAGVVDARP